jgi:hypothetical protein
MKYRNNEEKIKKWEEAKGRNTDLKKEGKRSGKTEGR